jgi:transcriptional regulator GlxA family with amidase domain
MSQIAFIAYDNCLASSVSLASEMLSAAIDAQTPATRESLALPGIYGSRRKIHCAGGIEISTHAHPKTIANPDIIFLAAIWRNPLNVVRKQQYLIPLLQRWAANGTNICAIGSSSCLLAEAGLLDQKAATTHWTQLEKFKQRYPAVKIQKDFLITRSDNIYCAASINSGADLMIYFIESLHGKTIAQKVEANFSPEVRKSYASSLYIDQQHKSDSDEDMVRLQHWMRENFKQTISSAKMAQMMDMSVRTLNRRFKLATNSTPNYYLQQLKVEYAKALLKNSNLSIGDIAQQCGFCDASHFSSVFKRFVAITAGDYRSAVKAKLFS